MHIHHDPAARWVSGWRRICYTDTARRDRRGGGGEREVRRSGVGQSRLGSRLGCRGRVDGVIPDKEILVGF